LYAVVAPGKSAGEELYRIIFVRPGDGRAYWFNVSDSRILSFEADCGKAEKSGWFDGEHIVPPQFEYAPDAPPPDSLIN
jgi:hypothetical protein